jgi:hypothetical protein
MDTYLARRQQQWLGHLWRMDWTGLPRKLLTAWVPVEETWVGGWGGGELTWGESVEKKLKRASHAFLSGDDEPTLCAEALPFVPQSLVVTAGTGPRRRRRRRRQQQRKASGWTYHVLLLLLLLLLPLLQLPPPLLNVSASFLSPAATCSPRCKCSRTDGLLLSRQPHARLAICSG